MNNFNIDYKPPHLLIKEYTDENGDTWTLEGYCSQCGQCCINPKYNVGFNDENGRCTNLIYETINGVVKYRCSIYWNRPVSCAIWPMNNKDIEDNNQCTFKYIKKE